jgi:hypothetical protein
LLAQASLYGRSKPLAVYAGKGPETFPHIRLR